MALRPAPRGMLGCGLAGLLSLAMAGCPFGETSDPARHVPTAGRAEGLLASGSEDPGGPGDVGLTPAQRRGREIYLHGAVPGGRPIRAILARSREPVDAALLACASCHGHDGRGRPEGDVEPPDVTWSALDKPYGATDRFGRRRPAYTESLLGRVVTMGLDSAGRSLDAAMPRYQLAPEDLADLVAFLTVLGRDTDPGLGPSTITIGTLLSPVRSDPGWRDVVLATLRAYVDDVNRRGGLYNRRLDLAHAEIITTGDAARASVAEFLDRRSVFALVAGDIRGVDEEIAGVVEDRGVPLIGPFTLRPESGSPGHRCTFYLHGGLEDQARALVASARASGARGWAIVHADDPASARTATALAAESARTGDGGELVAIPRPCDRLELCQLAARLAARRIERIVYLGPSEMVRPMLEAAEKASWRPEFDIPGALAGRELLDLSSSFGGKIVLALPYLPDDMSPAGREEYDRLRASAGLPAHHRAAQMAVLAAAKLFEEGIRRCGEALSRARLTDELERLSAFSTGFSRPLTFGPNRRIGSTGAYLLMVDPAGHSLQPTGGWVEVGGHR
jgi:ABC-type branched-subunit amino acid transport system substrate-binding protein